MQELGRDILSTDPEEFGDLILDVAEAFMSGALYEDSLPFLKRLVDSEAYGKVLTKSHSLALIY